MEPNDSEIYAIDVATRRDPRADQALRPGRGSPPLRRTASTSPTPATTTRTRATSARASTSCGATTARSASSPPNSIATSTNPTWSRDGRRIYFAVRRPGHDAHRRNRSRAAASSTWSTTSAARAGRVPTAAAHSPSRGTARSPTARTTPSTPAEVGLLRRRQVAAPDGPQCATCSMTRELGPGRGNLEHDRGRRTPRAELADPPARLRRLRRSIRWSSRSTAGRSRTTGRASPRNCSSTRLPATTCCSRTRAAARATARNSAT